MINTISHSWRRIFAVMGIVVCVGAAFAQGAAADGVPVAVRFGGDMTATRIVLDVAESVEAKMASAEQGRQLVLEFPRLDASELNGAGRGLVENWSLARAGGGSRLTLDLSGEAEIDRRFLLAPGDGVAFYRYVIDVKSAGTGTAVAAASATPARMPSPPNPNLGKRVIVIDPGHGGRDPGALGDHHQEKAITLAAAKELKTTLEGTGRYTVVLTREDDRYIELEDRVSISRRANADLFISLHADAGAQKSTRGASVYTLSDQGSDRVARTADSNSNWAIDVAGGTGAVREILFDLTQRATRNKSGAFAEILIQHVASERPLLTRAHRDAGYVVLFAPDVPAVLLEMGFITNPDDEAALGDAAEREVLVGSIARAIDAYFNADLRMAST
jgi:N-acetylmuramoyl-L-alanine amidase